MFATRKNIKQLVIEPVTPIETAAIVRPTGAARDLGIARTLTPQRLLSNLPGSTTFTPTPSRTHLDDTIGASNVPPAISPVQTVPRPMPQKPTGVVLPSPFVQQQPSQRQQTNGYTTTHAQAAQDKNLRTLMPSAEDDGHEQEAVDGGHDGDVEEIVVVEQPAARKKPPPQLLLQLPKLTKKGYYMIPSLEELASGKVDMTAVLNFTVGRENFGSIQWPGRTNIRGLDLDRIVHIGKKEVDVYPDKEFPDHQKPRIGDELNKPAIISLIGVWPNNQQTSDQAKIDALITRLKKKATAWNSTFINYDSGSGEWMFRVNDFGNATD